MKMTKLPFSSGVEYSPQFFQQHSSDTIEIIGFDQNIIDDQEHIYFGIEMNDSEDDDYTSEQYEILLTKLLENKTNKSLLQISNEINQTDGMFHRHGLLCSMSYKKTVDYYHQTNDIYYEELVSEIQDIIDCYKLCVQMNLPIHLSENDMSLVTVQNLSSPYPQIVVTPYAFINALFPEEQSEEDDNDNENKYSIHLQFSNIFEYFHNKLKRMKSNENEHTIKEENYFMDIIEKLKSNKDVTKEIDIHPFFKQIEHILTIPKFKFKEYTELEIECGSGTYGTVTVMKRNTDGKLFAMKEVGYSSIPSLHKEAFILKSMNHRNIIHFVGFKRKNKCVKHNDNDNQLPHGFMIMELCEFGNLEDVIHDYKNNNTYLSYNLVQQIFGQICEACLYIHYNKRFVHRDLKLGNILISSIKPFIEIKLCDFGFTRSNDTEFKSIQYSPYCADLRLLQRKQYDDRADLVSIGCILYCLVKGEYPCEDCNSHNEIIRKLKSKQIDLEIPKGRDKRFKKVMELVIHLMNLDECNMSWDEFRDDEFVVDCIGVVNELRKKYDMKDNE